MTSFVIQNNSDREIEIEYSLCCPEAKFWYMAPKSVESNKLGYRGPNWNEIAEAVHLYDEKKGVVSLSLPENQSVFVSNSLNYTGYRKNKSTNFLYIGAKNKILGRASFIQGK